VKTATYTVMFTDIQDFTERTSRQTRAQNSRLLRLHDALLLPVIEGFRGRRVKSIGDAYLVIFDSATRALACGAAIQDRLYEFNRRAPEEDRLQVKVALSAGEVRLERGDVFGAPVNTASRVEALARGGEVIFSESVLLLAEGQHFPVEALGSRELRGIPGPTLLYRLRPQEEGQREGGPFGGAALAALELPPLRSEDLGRLGRPAWAQPLVVAAVAIAALGSYAVFSWF